MKVAIHQPYFVPYIGYWQLIDSVDIFAIADNYNYIKQGWINRNRILEQNTIRYFNLEVAHASQNRFINDHQLKPIDKEKKLAQLKGFYSKAPYKDEGIELVDRILSYEGQNLADFLFNSIQIICEYLKIETKIVRTSDYPQDLELKFTDRIFDYCHQMGADEYYNLIGGMKLYSFEEFAAQGIKLIFVESIPMEYPQSSTSFEFGLSIIDVIMNNSQKQIADLLKSRRFITTPECIY